MNTYEEVIRLRNIGTTDEMPDVETPAEGTAVLFLWDGVLHIKDSTGTITPVGAMESGPSIIT